MNKVMLIGNLTRDPEQRTASSGNSYVQFGMATNVRGQGGQQETTFYNVRVFGRQVDFITKYLTKGRKVAVVGTLSLRMYDRNDGTKAIAADVMADDVQTVGGDAPAEGGTQQFTPRQNTPFSAGNASPQVDPGALDGFAQVDDDDLPF